MILMNFRRVAASSPASSIARSLKTNFIFAIDRRTWPIRCADLIRTRFARATYFSVLSMFFSFNKTYHKPCRSSNDFNRNSLASHSRPLTSSFCLSSGMKRMGSRNAFRPSFEDHWGELPIPRVCHLKTRPHSPKAADKAVRRASLTSACIVSPRPREWGGNPFENKFDRDFMSSSPACQS